jgi:hypothetical protein
MNLRAAARGYWSGDLDYMDFFTIMQSAIQKGFREAWTEGAGAYGIKTDEYTDKERIRLQQEINKEIGFVDRLATFVERHSKANKGKILSEEHKNKISNALKGKQKPDGFIDNLKNKSEIIYEIFNASNIHCINCLRAVDARPATTCDV